MATEAFNDFDTEPAPKRRKLDNDQEGAPVKIDIIHECPIHLLPADVLSKIIAYIPIAQWPSMELVDTNFRESVLLAWRSLRKINLEDDFSTKIEMRPDLLLKPIESLLEKLIERSPFLTSLNGVALQNGFEDGQSNCVSFFSQFAHLESIVLGNGDQHDQLMNAMPFENLVEFLESTNSRSTLKEIVAVNVPSPTEGTLSLYDRFSASFVNGSEIEGPLVLEKLSLSAYGGDPFQSPSTPLPLGSIDVSKMTDLDLGHSSIDTAELADLIARATKLRRLTCTFMHCHSPRMVCDDESNLRANKILLTALSSHESLIDVKFDAIFVGNNCNKCTKFEPEFFEMLKSMGRRGRVTKLAFASDFVWPEFHTAEMFEIIRQHIPNLRSLEFHMDNLFSGRALREIAGMPNLEEIRFSHDGDYVDHDDSLTAEIVEELVGHQRLRCLALESIAHHGEALFQLSQSTTLMDLRIRYCDFVFETSFDYWADGFGSNLRTLMLSGVGRSYRGTNLGGLIRKAVQLRVLVVEGDFLPWELLSAVAESCPQLEELGLRPHQGISFRRLQNVIDGCTKLKKLGGIEHNVWKRLKFPKYRQIRDVDLDGMWNRDFSD